MYACHILVYIIYRMYACHYILLYIIYRMYACHCILSYISYVCVSLYTVNDTNIHDVILRFRTLTGLELERKRQWL